ncbi:General vesicular transport factor, partial [Paragonimus heterotremus]
TYEPHIRRHAIRLLTVLLVNQLKETQSVILQCPKAVSKIVDILDDPREALRNDALLLLLELTKSHLNIQKIVAFENTFERLFSIIQLEGLTDGGVVVEDCLRILWQLLDGNAPNQILFKENNFIQRLLPLLEFKLKTDDSEPQWSAQNVVNVDLTMQIIRTLVSPRNKVQYTRQNQTSMYNCGLLPALCNLILAIGVPAEVLTRAIYTVADVVRGCATNQEYLAHLIAPSEPPQPVIAILLVSMVNERQVLAVRAAALYCFQCYVASNRQTQSAIVATLLPKSADESQPISVGQLLCGGLFSNDVLSTWFSSIALSHCITENISLQEELLRVHLASGPDGTSVSLLQQCFVWFQKSTRFQTRIGLLQLLCMWLAYCPAAVRAFLTASAQTSSGSPRISESSADAAKSVPRAASSNGANLSALIAEAASLGNDESDTLIHSLITLLTCICVLFNPGDVAGFDKKSLLNTLEKRIGFDVILEQLNQVSKAESFTSASKHPELKYECHTDLVFDYAFTRLFKRLEYEVIRAFQTVEEINGTATSEILPPSSKLLSGSQQETHSNAELVAKLAKKDTELRELRVRIENLELELRHVKQAAVNMVPIQTECNVAELNHQLAVYDDENRKLQDTVTLSEQRIRMLEEQLNQSTREKENIKLEQDDLLVLLHDQDVKLQRLRELVKQLGGHSTKFLLPSPSKRQESTF